MNASLAYTDMLLTKLESQMSPALEESDGGDGSPGVLDEIATPSGHPLTLRRMSRLSSSTSPRSTSLSSIRWTVHRTSTLPSQRVSYHWLLCWTRFRCPLVPGLGRQGTSLETPVFRGPPQVVDGVLATSSWMKLTSTSPCDTIRASTRTWTGT